MENTQLKNYATDGLAQLLCIFVTALIWSYFFKKNILSYTYFVLFRTILFLRRPTISFLRWYQGHRDPRLLEGKNTNSEIMYWILQTSHSWRHILPCFPLSPIATLPKKLMLEKHHGKHAMCRHIEVGMEIVGCSSILSPSTGGPTFIHQQKVLDVHQSSQLSPSPSSHFWSLGVYSQGCEGPTWTVTPIQGGRLQWGREQIFPSCLSNEQRVLVVI